MSHAGEIRMTGASSAPSGWLLCEGQEVSRTGYPDLFSAIGTTFGDGDGSTTFNVPDTRSRVPLGAGEGSGLAAYSLGGVGGVESVALDLTEIPSHNHSAALPAATGAPTSSDPTNRVPAGAEVYADSADVVETVWTTGNTGGARRATAAHENRQPWLVLNFMIALWNT